MRPEHGKKTRTRSGRFSGCRAAFTLIELLVVLAIVAILASMMLPVMARARSKAVSALCVSNHRQLSVALHLYAGDNQDGLPYNLGVAGTRQTIAARSFANWANSLLNWELDPANTNIAWLRAGGLGPFMGGACSVFRCPADRVLSDIQRSAGWSARARSVSLNAMIGNAGEFLQGHKNTNNPAYRQHFRLGDARLPSLIFTFIDEHPDSINDGYFLNRVQQSEWVDLPASYHNQGATVSFADGHAETHRWRLAQTRPPARPDAARLPMPVPASERTDFDWLIYRTTSAAYPSGADTGD